MKSKRTESTPEADRSRTYPCYKLQVWDDKPAVWVDIEDDFALRDDMIDYAFRSLDWSTKTRMVTVKANGRRWIDPDFDFLASHDSFNVCCG